MLDLFLEKSSRTERHFGISMIFGAWAASDPEHALAHASQMLPADMRGTAMQAAIGSWASTDYPASRKYAENLPEGRARREAMQALFQTLAQQNPQLAIREGMALGRDGWSAVQSAIWQIAQNDPESAATLAMDIPHRQLRDSALQNIASAWANRDPEAAITWVDSLDGSVRFNALANVVANWVRESPEEARQWLTTQSDLPRRNELIQRSLYSLMEQDPLKALDFIELVASESQQATMIENLANSWNRQDPATAQEWAEAQTDAIVRDRIWRGIIASTAEDNPAQAISLLENLPEQDRKDSVRNIAMQWGQDDPESALEWVSSVSDVSFRQDTIANVLSMWIREDSADALQWFSKIPAGGDRDALVSRLQHTLFQVDPAAAARWASTISDPDMRASNLQSLGHRWFIENPQAAREWVMRQSGLSPEIQQQIFAGDKR